jgi:hypothetical protein
MSESLENFITSTGLQMRVKRARSNPNMSDPAWSADHWACTLVHPVSGNRMRVTFSMGKGHNGEPPELPEVLDCLASDAAGVDGVTFEQWCDEYGYSTDSRSAERTYRICKRQAERLQSLLGHRYEDLLFNTERL